MKIRRSLRFVLSLGLGLLIGLALELGGALQAQMLPRAQPIDLATLSWPRFFATNNYEFAIYQPSIDQWSGNQLDGRLVVAVRPAATSNETYGVVFFQARTDIDKVNRLVTLDRCRITKVNFPTQPERQEQYLALLRSFQQHTARVIPLDHLEAVFAASTDASKAKVQQVKNDPPRVIYATEPSLLVLVEGKPVLKPLTGEYQRVINTRPVLLLNASPAYRGYYLSAANRWYSAPALEGPWTLAQNLPPGLGEALQVALATKQVDPLKPKDPNAPLPTLHIYVSTTPAELLETSGAPNLVAIPNTALSYVANTSNAIFLDLDNSQYYVLISGRWFKAPSLQGPYAFVPAGQLPADFQKIPADHEKSNALVSVPGTPQAREAVIANSIPQTATVERSQAKLQVEYLGAPDFTPITGTSLAYAVNTATPVIQLNAHSYYACQGGVWFQAAAPTGPWTVASLVPEVIYTLPPSCPIHYVTYVYVYGATPETVYVGYTPGYAGTVVAPGNVVVFGTGYYYPPVVLGTAYVSYPPTYGYGAGLALGAFTGFAFGYAAGASMGVWSEPHWGCYGWAYPVGYSYTHVNVNSANFYTHWGTAVQATGSYGYNAWTGGSWAGQRANTFNPYTGTQGTVARGAGYNPYTGNYAAGREGSWYNPYSGAEGGARSGAAYNPASGNYEAGRQAAGYNPTTGRYGAAGEGIEGNVSSGSGAGYSHGVVGSTTTGNAVGWNNGTMYADKSGNVYKYNPGTGAQQYNNGSWQAVNSSRANSFAHENSAQTLGAQRAQAWHSAGGGGWGGFHGGGRGRR